MEDRTSDMAGYARALRGKERYRRTVKALAEVIAADCFEETVANVERTLYALSALVIFSDTERLARKSKKTRW